MTPSFKAVFLIIFSLLSFSQTSRFNIATFNVKWFGLGGEFSGTIKDEYRDPWLKEYITKELSETKAIMFQEIIDVPRLARLMDDFDMSCQSYDQNIKKHQHLVFCLDNDFEFIKEKGEEDFVLEEVDVANGWLRPGLYGIVRERKTRKKLFHVIGVHLKANSDESLTRLKQVRILKDAISEINDTLPFVLLGDFNTYKRKETDLDKDDLHYFSAIFRDVSLKYVKHNYKYTYRNGANKQAFDHAWVSSKIKVDNISVGQSCNFTNSRKSRFENSSFFNRFVSDHCPLSFDLLLK